MKDYRLIIGAILIIVGFLGHRAPDFLNSIKNNIFKNKVQVVDIKPSDDIIKKSTGVSSLITDKEDRMNLAIFHLEFANRLDQYFDANITNQTLVDLYTASLKELFRETLKDKYNNLSTELELLLQSSLGDVEHILSKDELSALKQDLLGLSWNLSN